MQPAFLCVYLLSMLPEVPLLRGPLCLDAADLIVSAVCRSSSLEDT